MRESRILDAFNRAILANPEDRTHRLVCSDWLRDHGQDLEAARYQALPGTAAVWCSEWGDDEFGLWAALEIEQIEQRLRWIPTGSFRMGSLQEERDELSWLFPRMSPSHEVTLTCGFWMFDTPCTQELWEVVKGRRSTRSGPRGGKLPRDRVNLSDVQEFLERSNRNREGLDLRLPSEAEWEYACRATTKGAWYHDDLDDIAWHLENSEGVIQPVKRKQPNDWGLYDMLGNVWERCADGPREYAQESVENPIGPVIEGKRRCTRGGAVHSSSNRIHAAFRNAWNASSRGSGHGFRCCCW